MKNEVFAVSAYNVITWHDDRLEWDPEDRDFICRKSKVFEGDFSSSQNSHSLKSIFLKGL